MREFPGFPSGKSIGAKRVRLKLVFPFLLLFPLVLAGCFDGRVKRDLVLAREFHPQAYSVLAVINLDPQIQFSQYVEAELLRKGYKVKEGITVGQLLKKEGFLKEGALDAKSLPKMAALLQVQGIVLCNVMEFSRFRDSYRLGIRCVAPKTGDTLWYAEGAKEGRRGQKSSELLKEIVVASLSKLPALP
jgi:hypothetical protein